MNIYRIYSDSEGESHFEELNIPMTLTAFAPPAPSLGLSESWEATQVSFLHAYSGWYGDWHPAPKRQLMLHLAGDVKAETSDGQVLVVGPGSVVLLEDTTGKGHRSWVISSEDVIICVIELEDQ